MLPPSGLSSCPQAAPPLPAEGLGTLPFLSATIRTAHPLLQQGPRILLNQSTESPPGVCKTGLLSFVSYQGTIRDTGELSLTEPGNAERGYRLTVASQDPGEAGGVGGGQGRQLHEGPLSGTFADRGCLDLQLSSGAPPPSLGDWEGGCVMFRRQQGQSALGGITFYLSPCVLLDRLASSQPGWEAGRSQAAYTGSATLCLSPLHGLCRKQGDSETQSHPQPSREMARQAPPPPRGGLAEGAPEWD